MVMLLPIDDAMPRIVQAVAEHACVVLTAEPGAGKTTRVPRALWQQGSLIAASYEHRRQQTRGEIWVTQPRRLAARLAAQRIADELGEPLGQTVGYHVRFDSVASAHTRIRLMSEGVLLRRLLHDPTLADAACIVLDEFHERHLDTDVAWMLLRQLQRVARPDLKIVVMSATLDQQWAAAHFADAAILHVPGKVFPVEVVHAIQPDARPLPNQVASALTRLLAQGLDGDVLVFLPGMAEIQRTEQACAALAKEHDLAIARLHGSLSKDEQQRAVQRLPARKVILSTNVAETSVTIDGVVAVIDSGLARVPHHDAWSGLPHLRVRPISKASAIQRAGRAGRTQPGVCVRLYTQHDFQARPAHDTPDIMRFDLSSMVLMLHGLQPTTHVDPTMIASWPWLDIPPNAALDHAQLLLQRLGALHGDAHALALTPIGQAMLDMPLHPRTARIVIEAAQRGVMLAGCTIAALLEDGAGLEQRDGGALSTCSDVLAVLHLFERERDREREGAMTHVHHMIRQLREIIPRHVRSASLPPPSDAARDDALCMAILTGYPDRVGKRCPAASGSGYDVLLAQGGRYTLPIHSAAVHHDVMVVVDVAHRNMGTGKVEKAIRLASGIEPEWLIDLFPEHMHERSDVIWNAKAERVDVHDALMYGELVLEASTKPSPPTPDAAQLLRRMLQQHGRDVLHEDDAVKQLRARVAFLHSALPEAGLPAWDDAHLETVLAHACEGCISFADVRAQSLYHVLWSHLTPKHHGLLARAAPERITLPNQRSLVVHYDANKSPWVESRVQDFFGMGTSPMLAEGRVAVTVHLLAPNRRPVQITTDLKSFWTTHYPSLRPALARRYPRHAWPENPAIKFDG